MSSYLHPLQELRFRKRYRFVLAFFWLTGFCLGIMAFLAAGDVSDLIYEIPWRSVSLFDLLCVNLLPFFLSVVASSAPHFLLLTCSCKAFLTAYVTMGILVTFGDSGWFYCCILLFSSWGTVPVLYLFWLRQISMPGKCNWSAAAASGLIIGISFADLRIVAPGGRF